MSDAQFTQPTLAPPGMAVTGGMRDRAHQAFGEPWLSPVLRAITAVDVFATARDAAQTGETTIALVEVEPVLRAAVDRCWESAVVGQRIHTESAEATGPTSTGTSPMPAFVAH